MDVSGDTLGWTIEDCYCAGGKGVLWRGGRVESSLLSQLWLVFPQ